MRFQNLNVAFGMGWYLGEAGSGRAMAGLRIGRAPLEAVSLNSNRVAGNDDDEKIGVMDLGLIVSRTGLALAFCAAAHWAAVSFL